MYANRSVVIGLIVVLLVLVVACTSGASPPDGLLWAITKTSEVQSYRSTGTTTTYADTDTFQSSWESAVAAPDRYRVKTIINTDWREFINIGNTSYVLYAESPQWQVCLEGTCGCVHTPIYKSLHPLHYMVDVEVLQEDEINGVNCSHYQGRVDMTSFIKEQESIIGGMTTQLEEMRRWEICAELWIDSDDYIRNMKTEVRYPYTDPTSGNERWSTKLATMCFFDFDEAISVEPPEIE